MPKILVGHSLRRKPLLETLADLASVEIPQSPDRLSRLYLPVDDISGHSVIDNFRH